MKITQIDCHVLLDPGYDVGATSSSQDDIVVEVHTDEGITGIGESDLNPWIGRACIRSPGHAHHGTGAEPDAARARSIATGAVMGKALRRLGHERAPRRDDPCHGRTGHCPPRYPGKSVRQALATSCWEARSSLSSHPTRHSSPRWVRSAPIASRLSHGALLAKANGFSRSEGGSHTLWAITLTRVLARPHEQMTEVIGEVRAAVGADFTLMVDVQYAFADADACLKTIRNWTRLQPILY